MITPLVHRTWAPRGQTPVLYQRGRSRQKVSVTAALVIPPSRDRARVERLPPYAPELNPVELVWGHTKRNPLANYAPPDLDALVQATRRGTRRLAGNQPVLGALIRHCGLSLHLK